MIIEKFIYRKKICIISKISPTEVQCADTVGMIEDLKQPMPEFPMGEMFMNTQLDFHNGYVVLDKPLTHDIFREGIIYEGHSTNLDDFPPGYVIGFDTAHYFDTEETKSYESVRGRLQILVDELIGLGY